MANADANDQTAPSLASTVQADIIQASPFGMNLTQTLVVKLDKNNFLLWKNMIMPIIRGHNLEGYLLGIKQCPQEFIATQTTFNGGEAVETTQNLEYNKWISTDQLLMGWLYSSMTPEIAMRVMKCTSSNILWTTVEKSYGILNKSRIVFLTREIQRTRK